MSHSIIPRKSGSRTWLAFIFTLWTLVVTACTLPGIWQPSEEPGKTTPQAQTPTIQRPLQTVVQPTVAQPKPTAAPLPPALVESTPLPSSELGPRQPIILYFNQSMEKGSVEGALHSAPAVAGHFKWLNDYSVSFTPDKPLPVNSNVVFNLSTQARAANGLALGQPVELAFRTSAGLKEIDLLPKPNSADVDPASAIVATFNRPVVSLGVDPTSLVPAFSIESEANGRGEWLNTSTYIFYPEPPLIGGREYTIKFKPDLTAADGSEWSADHVPNWKFKTVLPKLLTINPDGKKNIFLDDAITLIFNQAMEKSSVEQGFSLNSGEAVAGKFTWKESATQVVFKPGQLLKRATNYTVNLSGSVKSLGGATIGSPLLLRYSTVPPLAISALDPAPGSALKVYDVSATVRLKLTAPLAKQDLKSKISITPSIGNITVIESINQDLFISGAFKPSTKYDLTIAADLQDKWGATLEKPFVMSFSTMPSENMLSLVVAAPYSSLVFITPTETSLPAQATNVKTVRFSLAKLTMDDFARLEVVSGYDRDAMATGGQTTWEKKYSLPENQSTALSLPLTSNGGTLAPGLYLYSTSSPELTTKNVRPLPALLLSSRVHLVIKVSTRQAMVWAVNMETQQVIAGSPIEFYSASKGKLNRLGSATTNNQGVAQIEIPQRQDIYEPVVAVLGKPGDPLFSLVYSDWSEWLEGYSFGVPTNYAADGLDLYFYTDRPIYRPGQTVYFRGTVNQKNNGRYSPADLKQLNVKILGTYPPGGGEQPVIARQTLPVSAYGTVTGSFELPETAAPGHYMIEIEQGRYYGLGFQVAEYRKPEVDLSAGFDKADYKVGDELKAQVKAKYFFGAPAGNMNLRWTLTARSDYFRHLPGYQAGDWDTGWMLPTRFATYLDDYNLYGKFIASGEGRTSADGSLAISVPVAALQENAKSANLQELILEVTVMDEGVLNVSTRASSALHPADFYIGIKSEAWNGRAKQALGFSIQAADWKGAPTGIRNLTATFQKVTWKEKENWQPESGTIFETILIPVATTDFKTDAQGKARVEFTPPEAGTYQLEVKGGGAVSRSLVWVGGEGRTPWPKLPDQHLHLQLDAEEYAPGQNARLFIPNPLGEATLALITVERSRVMKTDVVAINGNQLEYTLQATADDAPNVFITVTLLGKTDGAPDYRHGIIQLNVKPDALRLQVQATAEPQRAQPGAETRLKVTVRDGQGKPVQGEFSAALVDKAVLALADPNSPPIFEAFYGTQPLAVQTSLALSNYTRRMEKQLSPPGRGGGGGDFATTPELRSDFKDTAYWNGSFQTDAGGNAELLVKLPDNLTTWVVIVRGLSLDRRVGEGSTEIVTSKDLLVMPVTPRFLVVGDRVELAAWVHNTTAKPIAAEVTLLASGVELENPGGATQKVDLPANDRRRVTWWVKVNGAGQADLRFTVKGGGLQDASKPVWGDLPIREYSAPQTYATSGILAEAGERLEVISVPRSFTPTGGEMRVEMTSSLAATILNGLKAIEIYPYDHPEAILSRLFPNLHTYQILKKMGMESPDLKARLEGEIKRGISRISGLQNSDGGWGWAKGQASHPYLSAYALLVLSEAQSAGLFLDSQVLAKAQTYTTSTLVTPTLTTNAGILERVTFQQYALMVSGKAQSSTTAIYDFREKLSPWARAMLVLTLNALKAGDERARNLISDLQARAARTATGAYWDVPEMDGNRLVTPNFSTAIVVLALARLDPAAAMLPEAVRYLVSHRQACGCWTSSYEAAWVLTALGEVLQATGDLNANFTYSAALNGAVLASGKAGGAQSLNAAMAVVPLGKLNAASPNALTLSHDAGSGRLYYRVFLQVNRPVESAQPLQAGISLTRRYYLGGQDCRKVECKPVDRIKLSDNQVIMVRLTVTVPRPMYYLMLEDTIPAGFEIVNTNLKTTQRFDGSGKPNTPAVNPRNPFGEGWNWWVFGEPQIRDESMRWMGSFVPAGTYEVTYRLTPLQVGEYRAIPAHVYQNYFPEVQGTSAGAVFTILP